jgi:hypothetical protein
VILRCLDADPRNRPSSALNVAMALLRAATLRAMNVLVGTVGTSFGVAGVRFLTSFLLGALGICAYLAIGYILVLVLLRSVVRRTWVADALFVVLFSAILSPILSGPEGFSFPAAGPWILWFAAVSWVLRRFGLLAVLAAVYASFLTVTLPLPVASWYAAYALTTPVLIVAAAAWSLYVILTSRPGRVSRSAAEPLV